MTTSQDEATRTEQHAAPPEAWDAIAEGYDRFVAPQEVDLANQALRRVGLQPGERFLDVAAGTGGLSLPAARLGAHVLASDWSPAMIERFEARVRQEGLSNAAGRVMDCHALELPDDSFDVTGSQFGVMLVPDQPRALREMVRVTRPGGRVLVIVYGSPKELEFLQVFIGALTAVAPGFPGLPDDPPPPIVGLRRAAPEGPVPAGAQPPRCSSRSRSSTRRILPEMVLGSSTVNSISRGYL